MTFRVCWSSLKDKLVKFSAEYIACFRHESKMKQYWGKSLVKLWIQRSWTQFSLRGHPIWEAQSYLYASLSSGTLLIDCVVFLWILDNPIPWLVKKNGISSLMLLARWRAFCNSIVIYWKVEPRLTHRRFVPFLPLHSNRCFRF